MKDKKFKSCCFRVHRNISKYKITHINDKLIDKKLIAIEKGYTFFYVGGALGFDTLAAQTILELKKEYTFSELNLVLPCVTQSEY